MGEAARAGGAGGGGRARRPRPRGVARPADRPRRAARLAAPAALAAARPAGDRRHRAHLGRRDPARGAALAVQARRRPVRARRSARCATAIASELDARDRRSTRRRCSSRCPRSSPSRRACTPTRASRARAARRSGGGLLRGLRDDATAPSARPRAASSRTAGSRGCSSESAMIEERHPRPRLHAPEPGRRGHLAVGLRRPPGGPVLLPEGGHARLHDAGVRDPRPLGGVRRGSARWCSASPRIPSRRSRSSTAGSR